MCRYRVNQQLIVLNLNSVSINKILVMDFIIESFTESKVDVKYISTVKSTTQLVGVFKSNRMFGTKPSETNLLQITIEYKTNEESTKNSY